MKHRVSHVTRYAYAGPVSLCHSVAHLKPRPMPHQRVINASLRVTPWPSVTREHQDFFGNRVSYFSLQQSHSMLEISAISEVEVEVPQVPAPDADPPWESAREQLRAGTDADHLAARAFALPSPAIPPVSEAVEFAQSSFAPGRPLIEAARDLMQRIDDEFEYDPSFTTVATPISEVLEHRRGVCQDFAHLGIAALRGLGLAARYVSGYLETLPPPDKPKLRGADASHAWFAIFVPGHGWIDFDPTNNCLIGEQHITTAIGRDYQDVTPVRGVFYGGGEHELKVSVDVDRIQPTESAA
jgi:transglutaminase-like putative cysteine protease